MVFALVIAAHALLQAPQAGLSPSARDTTDSERNALRRDALSANGLPGLVTVPTASSTPSGMIDVAYTTTKTPSAFSNIQSQQSAFMAVGFLPRLTLTLRGTVVHYTSAATPDIRDLSDNVQLLLFTEGPRNPGFAIGATDALPGGAQFFKSRYAVASKSFADRVQLTLGYGLGPTLYKGVFGGAAIGLGQWATALGEYDGTKYNAGLRVFPLPSAADWIGIQPRVDVLWQQSEGYAVGFGVRTALGGNRGTTPTEARATNARSIESQTNSDMTGAARTVTDKLVAEGFENVRAAVVLDGGRKTLAVEYENRRYNRDELDALGVVMAITAAQAADSVTRMRFTIRRVDVPVIVIASDIALYRSFVKDERQSQAFADHLEITAPGAAQSRPLAGSPTNTSRFKLDVFARPRVETAILNELGVIQTRETLMADAWMQLAPGVEINGRRNVAVAASPNFPAIYVADPNEDRLLLHVAGALPFASHWGLDGALTQLSIGRFGHTDVGVADEINVPLNEGRVSLGATLGVLGPDVRNLDRAVALAVARVRYAPLDLTASLTAGRFRNGDAGAMAELSRFFGNTQLTFFMKSTEFGSVAGARVELPLTPTRELAPALVRPRLPDLYAQQLQAATLLKPGQFGAIRNDLGLLLDTDNDIARAFLNRDRLHPVTIRMHVGAIRSGSLRILQESGARE